MELAALALALLILSAVGAADQSVIVTGRHAVVPDPLNASIDAVAFDFNGVSLNATILGPIAVERIQVALTTSCFQMPNGSWSRTSHQPHRFRFYVSSPIQPQWLEPTGGLMVDTNGTTCNTLQWFELFNASAPGAEALMPPYDVSLFHITEPNWNAANATQSNYVLFHELRVYERGTDNVKSFHAPKVVQSIQSPRANSGRRKRIEFIGDSITAGYCNTCNLFPNASNNYALQDYSYSWARLTCAYFDADCHTEAWSGRGVIRNCDDAAPIWMPTIVKRAVGSVSEFESFWGVPNTWDFASFAPDVLVVNLGTNDYGCHPIPNVTLFNKEFEDAYVHMLTMLLVGYQNQTQGVFLACGPMSTEYCDAVHSIIGTMHSLGWSGVYFLNQTDLLPNSEKCCGHPDTVADRTMASFTVSAIQSALGWA